MQGGGGQHGEGGGQAGTGGDGGDKVDASTSGTVGSPNRSPNGGGQPGFSGYGLIFSNNTVQSNSTGDKTLASGDGGVHVGSVI